MVKLCLSGKLVKRGYTVLPARRMDNKKVGNWPTQRPMRLDSMTPNFAGRDRIMGIAIDTVKNPDHTFTKSIVRNRDANLLH